MLESALSQKISTLQKAYGDTIPIQLSHKFLGIISWKSITGYLWIEDGGQYWSVTVASGPTSHSLLKNRAIVAEIDKYSGNLRQYAGLTGAYRTALSLWPVYDSTEARKIFDSVVQKIEEVFEQYQSQKKAGY